MKKIFLATALLLGNLFAISQSRTVTTLGFTANYMPVSSGTSTQANGLFYQTGGNVGLGTTTPLGLLDVRGTSVNLIGTTSINTISNTYNWATYVENKNTSVANALNFGSLNVNSPNPVASTTANIYVGNGGTTYIGTANKSYSFAGIVSPILIGQLGSIYVQGSGTATIDRTAGFQSSYSNINAGTTVTKHFGYYFDINNTVTNAGATTNLYGFYGEDLTGYSGVPAAANRWGVYMADPSSNYFNGSVGIGTSALVAASKLTINGGNLSVSPGGTNYTFLVQDASSAGNVVLRNASNAIGVDIWAGGVSTFSEDVRSSKFFRAGSAGSIGAFLAENTSGNTVTSVTVDSGAGSVFVYDSGGTGKIQLWGGAGGSFFTTPVGIGIPVNTNANAASVLELASTTKGLLLPRMTTVQKNAISGPVAGLVIYDTDLNKICVYTGAGWETVTSL